MDIRMKLFYFSVKIKRIGKNGLDTTVTWGRVWYTIRKPSIYNKMPFSWWCSCVMLICDVHVWCSFVMFICDVRLWCSFVMLWCLFVTPICDVHLFIYFLVAFLALIFPSVSFLSFSWSKRTTERTAYLFIILLRVLIFSFSIFHCSWDFCPFPHLNEVDGGAWNMDKQT